MITTTEFRQQLIFGKVSSLHQKQKVVFKHVAIWRNILEHQNVYMYI